MPGRHVLKHGGLVTGKPQISNTNDAPNEAKAIRLLEAKNVRPEGKPGATDILLEGKAIFVCMEHAENVSLNGLGFDYLHPTMGEFLVTEVDGNTMKATIPDGTLYTVKDGALTCRGPRMGGYAKVFDGASGTFQGHFDPGKTVIEELSPGKISITFKEVAPARLPARQFLLGGQAAFFRMQGKNHCQGLRAGSLP